MSARLRFILLGILLLAILGVGYQMYTLTQQEELWSYWPLALFGAAWLFHWVYWLPSGGAPTRHHPGWLALAGSVLLGAGFPPVNFIPGLFLGFVPFLLLTERMESGRTLFRWAFSGFLGWNVFSTYWVANATLPAGLLAMGLNSVFMAGVLWFYYQVRKRFPGLGTIVLIPLWLSFEYLHFNWELNWPWLTLGNGLSGFPGLIQWYEYSGVLGGSFWVLAVNLILAAMIEQKNSRVTRGIQLGAVLLLFPVLSFWTKPTEAETKPEDTIDLLLVQPNFEPHYEQNNTPQLQQSERMVALISAEVDDELDYVILPETVLGGMQIKQIGKDKYTRSIQTIQDSFPQLRILMGLATHRFLTVDEKNTPFTRIHVTESKDTIRYESYNAAVQLNPGNTMEVEVYKKSKLVPGAEFFPFRTFLSFLSPIVDRMGGSVQGLGTQDQRTVFLAADETPVAPIICYESVFGEYVTGYLRGGAQLLIIMTNDGWWDHTAGHRQHAAYARLRAIETRRWVVRAANTGISSIIDASGQVISATEYGETTVLRGRVPKITETTFYVLWGDILGRLSSVFTVLILLNLLVRRLMPEKL